MKIRVSLICFMIMAIVSYHFYRKPSAISRPQMSGRSGMLSATSGVGKLQRSIQYYRDEIRRRPDSARNHLALARLFLQQARVTGRHHTYVLTAQNEVEQALKLEPGNLGAWTEQAEIFMIYHDFEKAADWAHRVVQRNPRNETAWGLYSDARKELGDYEVAIDACDRMVSLRPDLRSYSRVSHLREIRGDIQGARGAMRLAVDAGVVGSEAHAWAAYQLGLLYLKENKIDTAEFLFEGILQTRPGYPFALRGSARVERSRGHIDKAIQLLLQAFSIAPEHLFMEDLVDLYRESGQFETADVLVKSVLATYAQHEKQGWNVNLEFARFCLKNDTHLAEALKRVEMEYRRRPHHKEIMKIYRQALEKNGQGDAWAAS